MHRSLRPLVFSLLAAAIGCGKVAGTPASQDPRTLAPGSLAGACAARFADSSMVSVDGGYDAYVEGQTLVPAGGSYLLAGAPNYVSPPSPERKLVVPIRDSIFGAIRSPQGRWSLVPIPPPVRWFIGPRANAIGDGRWEVVFVQLDARFSRAHSEKPLGVWYGIVSATGWERLERIAVLDGQQVEYMNSTKLMRSGDTLTWAFQVWRSDEPFLPAAAVLRRIEGTWRLDVIAPDAIHVAGYQSADGAIRLIVEEVSLAGLLNRGIRYAVSPAIAAIDTVIPPSKYNRNYRQLDHSPDGDWSLTWVTALPDSAMWRTSVLLGPDRSPNASRTFRARYQSINRLLAPAGDAPWLFVADARDSHNNGRLEFLRVAPDRQASVGALTHRYIGPMVMAPRTNASLLYTGPVLVRDSSEARIASLLTTVDFNCRD